MQYWKKKEKKLFTLNIPYNLEIIRIFINIYKYFYRGDAIVQKCNA